MSLRPEQLEASLARGLKPVYAISGDEPLLVDEAVRTIRRAAREQGFDERQANLAERDFSWSSWLSGFDSLSLFSSRRLVELRLPNGKPGVEGGKTLEAWCSRPPPDTLLVLILPRADKAMQKTRWFTALDAAGVLVQVWPPEPARLPAWIGERLSRHGLQADRDTLAWLATRVEGNLLAAHQEIEKLALLRPPGPLDLAAVREAVLDVARFDAGDLADALLECDAVRYCRIVDGLAGEGEAPPLAIWLLAQDLRALYRLSQGLAHGESMPAVMNRLKVWKNRQPVLGRAVKRFSPSRLAFALAQLARADRAAKGLARADPWALLKTLGLTLMGKLPLNNHESGLDYGY